MTGKRKYGDAINPAPADDSATKNSTGKDETNPPSSSTESSVTDSTPPTSTTDNSEKDGKAPETSSETEVLDGKNDVKSTPVDNTVPPSDAEIPKQDSVQPTDNTAPSSSDAEVAQESDKTSPVNIDDPLVIESNSIYEYFDMLYGSISRTAVVIAMTPFTIINKIQGNSKLRTETDTNTDIHGIERVFQSFIDVPFTIADAIFDIKSSV